MIETEGKWWEYPWMGIGWDFDSTVCHIWVGWWLVTWWGLWGWRSLEISFQPGL